MLPLHRIASLLLAFSLLAADQTIEWANPKAGEVLLLNRPVQLEATASSGLPVSFRVVRGPAYISGDSVTATNLGKVELVAEQPGNPEFAPVSVVQVHNRSTVMGRSIPPPEGLIPASGKRVQVRGTTAFVPAAPRGLFILDLADPEAPKIISTIDTEGNASDVAVEGNLLLIADYQALLAYDISDLANPKLLSNYPSTPIRPRERVTISGTIAAVSYANGGEVEFVDYAEPATPRFLAKHPAQSVFVFDLAAAGGRFVAASGSMGLALFDINPVPLLPAVLGANSVDYSGNRLAAGIDGGQIAVFEPSATDGLIETGRYLHAGPDMPTFNGVAIGPRWIVGSDAQYARLLVVDFEDPRAPTLLGSFSIPASSLVMDVALTSDGKTAVVANEGGQVALVHFREGIAQDISFDLASTLPTSTTEVELHAAASTGRPVTFTVLSGPGTIVGDRLLVTPPGEIRIRATQAGDEQFLPASIDRVLVVADPPVITVEPTPVNVPLRQTAKLEVQTAPSANLSYQWFRNGRMVDGATGQTLNLTVEANRTGLYSVVITNAAGSVTSRWASVTAGLPGGGLALKARGQVGGMPVGAGSGAPVRIRMRDQLAWVANGWENVLRVFDVSIPDQPVQVAQAAAPSSSSCFDLALVDDTALVVERANGLGIYDISNPLQPQRVGNVRLPGGLANSILVRDRVAYVGAESAGIIILDVDNPRTPVILGSKRGRGSANGVHVDGSFAAAAEWSQGISLFDVSQLTAPSLSGVFPAVTGTGNAFAITGRSNVLYVGDSQRGLRTFDLRNPQVPSERPAIAGSVWDLQLAGRYLFGSESSGGLRIFDVSNPTNAVSLGSPFSGVVGLGICLNGNRLIQGGRDLRLFDVSFSNQPPVLTSTPDVRRLRTGSPISLHADAAGTGPFSYQWTQDGRPLEGATNATYRIDSIEPTMLGDYQVTVTGQFGSTSGRIAKLLPSAPTRLSVSASLLADGRVRFVVQTLVGQRFTVMGSDDLRQWDEEQSLMPTNATTEVFVMPGGSIGRRFYRFEMP